MEPLLLRAADVAKLLALGRSKVFAMLAAGELPAVRIGRSVRVPRLALERWIEERTKHTISGDESQSLSLYCDPSRVPVTSSADNPTRGDTSALRSGTGL